MPWGCTETGFRPRNVDWLISRMLAALLNHCFAATAANARSPATAG